MEEYTEEFICVKKQPVFRFVFDKVEINKMPVSSWFLSNYFKTEGVIILKICYSIVFLSTYTVVFLIDITWVIVFEGTQILWKGLVFFIEKVFTMILELISFLFKVFVKNFLGKLLKVAALFIGGILIYNFIVNDYLDDFFQTLIEIWEEYFENDVI